MKYVAKVWASGTVLLLVALFTAPPAAWAVEIQVLSAGAMRSIVTDLGATF